MRSLSSRLFIAIVVVSLVALAIGVWWVRRTVLEFDRQVTVERVVRADGRVIVNEIARDTTRLLEPANGDDSIAGNPRTGPLVDALSRRLLIALTVVIVGAAFVTAVISRRVLGPIGALRTAADRWSRGEFDARVNVEGHDELAALGRAFNAMAGQLDRQERLKRDLTNDIAHELRTPLTNLRCHVEALQDSVVAAGPDTWAGIGADIASLERLVRDLGELAQAEARQLAMRPEAVSIPELFDGLLREVEPRASAAGLTTAATIAPDTPPAWVDRGRLQQVLRNLVDNALAHTPAGGRIELSATRQERGVVLHVSDTGAGIDEVHLPHIFDRFYRADPSRSRHTGGAGLGLAIARQIVLASGGVIGVESRPGAGTRFAIVLPGLPSQVLHKHPVE